MNDWDNCYSVWYELYECVREMCGLCMKCQSRVHMTITICISNHYSIDLKFHQKHCFNEILKSSKLKTYICSKIISFK